MTMPPEARAAAPLRPWSKAVPRWLGVVAAALLAACGGSGDDATLSTRDDSATLTWNTTAEVDVLANDAAQGGTLALVGLEQPAHGRAEIVDGRILYTPQAGWFGRDRLTYTAGAAGLTRDATLDLTVQAQLVLRGRVDDAPLAGAAVTASVGTQRATANADADGAFVVELLPDAPEAVVRLEAAGAGRQAAVRLVGLAGSAGTLAAAADAGGVVDTTAAPGLRVSPLTTAAAALMGADAGGEPGTADALQRARDRLDGDALLSLATLLRLVAGDGEPLPAGVADTWALLRDAGASAAMRRGLQAEGRWYAAYQATLAAAPAQRFVGPASGSATVVTAGAAGSVAGGERFELSAGGGGSASAVQGTQAVTWSVGADGALVVRYAPARHLYDGFAPDDGTMRRYELTETRLAPLGSGFARAVQTVRSVYVDGPSAGSVADPATAGEPSVVALFDRLDAYPLAADALAAGRRWAGVATLAAPSAERGAGADLLEVTATGSARLWLSQANRTLALADGGFVLTAADGTAWRYRRLAPAGADGLETWLVQSGSGAAAWSEVLRLRPLPAALPADAAALARTWRWEPGAGSDAVDYVLRADGSASVAGGAAQWLLRSDGELRITRETRNDGIDRYAQWWPVALADGRLVVLRRTVFVNSGDDPNVAAALADVPLSLQVLADAGPAP